MGWVYGVNPLTGYRCLCCDHCGHCTGEVGETGKRVMSVQKIACPYGYCQAWATCDQCRVKKRQKISSIVFVDDNRKEQSELRINHAGCKVEHIKFLKQEAEKQELLDAGKFLRCAAYKPADRVKVLFRDGQKLEKAFFMSDQTYDSIPLGTNATIEDYQKFGELTPANNLNLHDPELPQN